MTTLATTAITANYQTAENVSNDEPTGDMAIIRLGICGRWRVACDSKTRQLYGLPILLFLCLLGAAAAIVVTLQINELSSLKSAALTTGGVSSGLLERTLDRALSSAVFLGQTMRVFPEMVEKNFTQLAQPLFNDPFLAVTNLQMAPNNTIKTIVPLTGNEGAIGVSLLRPDLNNGTLGVINNRDLTLIGPIALTQGGVGVLGRFPVFLPNGSDPTAPPSPNDPYWGIITSLVSIDQLIELGKLNSLRDEGYEYTLRKQGSATTFYQSSTLALYNPVLCYISVPHGKWELQLAPASGQWRTDPVMLALEIIISLVISLLSPMALLITLNNNVLFNNARAMQKQISTGKERETKMEATSTELNRKIAESDRIIARQTREIGTIAAAYQLCRDMLVLINISRPQSSVTASSATGDINTNVAVNRSHIIQHATGRARMHARQLTTAQTTQDHASRSEQIAGAVVAAAAGSVVSRSAGSPSPKGSPGAHGVPKSDPKSLGTSAHGGSKSVNIDLLVNGNASISTDTKLMDVNLTVEQIANHPIAVELLKDVMAADHSLENLLFYLDVQYYRRAYDDNQRGIMSGVSAGSGHALIRNIGEDIFCTYIGPLAPCEINISRDTRTKLQQFVGGDTPPSSMVSYSSTIRSFTKDTFDGALYEIKQLIRDNGIRQLQQHVSWPLCLQMLEIASPTSIAVSAKYRN